MNKGKYVILMLLMLVIACGGGNSTQNNNHEVRVAVEVDSASTGNMTVYRDYTGTLEGIEQAVLVAKVAETVTGVKVKPGERVRADQVLVALDKSGAASSYRQAKAYYDNAQKTFDKMKNLFDQGAISEKQYDDAKTAFDVAEANFVAARDIVEIKAPVPGVVTDLRVNVGDQTNAGEKLVTVSRVDSLRLTVGVDPADVMYFAPGKKGKVYPVGKKDDWTEGTVVKVAGSADPKTRAFNVELLFPQQGNSLLPGSFAGCTFPLREIKGVVRVPDDAIQLQEGLRRVYVIEGDSAFARSITTGENSGGFTEVVSGVESGDVLVTKGQAFLQDRTAIRIGDEEAHE